MAKLTRHKWFSDFLLAISQTPSFSELRIGNLQVLPLADANPPIFLQLINLARAFLSLAAI